MTMMLHCSESETLAIISGSLCHGEALTEKPEDLKDGNKRDDGSRMTLEVEANI